MLQPLSIYLLKVTCISALLFLYYFVALRNKKFHYYNRFYLLMAVAISIVLPFVQLKWFTFVSRSQQTIHLYNIIYGSGEADVVVKAAPAINWQQIIVYAFAFVCAAAIMVFAARILKIARLKKLYPVQKLLEFDFINTDVPAAPFSFLKNIFWRKDISLEDETGKQILQHEITHIQQKHSWDKVFMQLVLCFFWINPIYYLIKRELYLIHEFIADEHAVRHADADAFARMLLTARFGKFEFLPGQSIFYSSIKRRIIMLTSSKKPQLHYLRRLLVLPLLVSLVCLFAFTVTTNPVDTNIKNVISNMFDQPGLSTQSQGNVSATSGLFNGITLAATPFVLVVDAGHGGKDFGARGNGIIEKETSLKIAKEIKSISQQYGIDVVLTRNSDVFMDPRQKSEFANAQHADAFISIHINRAGNKEEQKIKSGMEVYVSEDNAALTSQSQLFGSAILQHLSTDFTAPPTLSTRRVGIWVLKNSNIPAALIECGYINNLNDANDLKNDAKIELMARNILQGVAMYANHSGNILQDNNIKNANDTTPAPADKTEIVLLSGQVEFPDDSMTISADKIVLKSAPAPLFVLDGKIILPGEVKKLSASGIESITVLKDKSAIEKYGEKGKNGVVEIISKNGGTKMKVVPDDVLYVLDGKIISKEKFLSIDRSSIESVSVLKDKEAIEKYGDKGKSGVVQITSKPGVKKFLPPLIIRDSDGVANPGKVDKVFSQVQQEPQFPGGSKSWQAYLTRNLNVGLLADNHAAPGTYTVTVSFLVSDDGSLYNVKALNDPGFGAGMEAVRVIAQGPKWFPAQQNGRAVAAIAKQKISFQVVQ